MWYGKIVGIMVVIPSLCVLLGGFYNPALLESVKNKKHTTIETKSMDDYREQEVIQVLASTIPPGSHLEAIKAQAVIARTYMLRRELGIIEEGELSKMSKEEMQALWKEDFEDIYEIYEQASETTKGEVIVYEDELIEPVYHKESAGYTRDALSLYQIDIPYLKAVESEGDRIKNEKVMLKTEMIERLKNKYPQILLNDQYLENQIQIVARDKSGYIESLQIGNVLMEGEVFRELFELQSSAFTIRGEKDTILFSTFGIGHGVGLSQNGANQMALLGKTYKESLEHYYTDIKITK